MERIGEAEYAVMEVLWRDAPLTATDVITLSSRLTRERHHSRPRPMSAAMPAKTAAKMFMDNPRVPARTIGKMPANKNPKPACRSR